MGVWRPAADLRDACASARGAAEAPAVVGASEGAVRLDAALCMASAARADARWPAGREAVAALLRRPRYVDFYIVCACESAHAWCVVEVGACMARLHADCPSRAWHNLCLPG